MTSEYHQMVAAFKVVLNEDMWPEEGATHQNDKNADSTNVAASKTQRSRRRIPEWLSFSSASQPTSNPTQVGNVNMNEQS